MIKRLIVLIIIVCAVIVGISIYLQPDSLSHCGTKPNDSTNCQSVDAIVAISGGDTEARASEAINLYKNGWSDIIIFSGAAQDKTGPSNAVAMETYAVKAGVPDSAIYLDESSETTKQNAENVQQILTKLDTKSIILVTSGYHQRRASLEFNKYMPDVSVLNHSDQNDNDWSIWWWATPRGWWLTASELAKIIAFYLVGA
jgi:uncharacterized SAM-binding protein YcdF (DUF218 family)